jgi:predicted transposase/invertase (TIGR01784 family)
MPLGIRPINDMAFKKTFGTPENKLCLISLLNAILNLNSPITDVTIKNPYNLQDFESDKLSILDIKATDKSGAIYDIEMQLRIFEGLVNRIVFYGCELYADQLRSGEAYADLKPVYSICLVDGLIWKDAAPVHQRFQLCDLASGRVLENTIEIHTLELARYDLTESDLPTASRLECWLFWLLHAHEYEPDDLLRLFPDAAFQQATRTIIQISEKTEDKAMYDAREKAIRDYQSEMSSAVRKARQEGLQEGLQEGVQEGLLEGLQKGDLKGRRQGRIELIQTLQMLLQVRESTVEEFSDLSEVQLLAMSEELRSQLRNRKS